MMRKKAQIVKENLLSLNQDYMYLTEVPKNDERLENIKREFWNAEDAKMSHYYREQSYSIEKVMKRLHDNGKSYVDIGKVMGCSSQNVRYHISEKERG